ncbi:SHOCT domain-containing protein, partial [Clostridium botulinum]|nr:SHOCT domain-containing protein [Clostridium botulinum]
FKGHIVNNNNAIKILNEKYATGEISEEEYLKRKNIMSK